MKKVFLFFLTLVSVQVFPQVSRTCTFHFENPASLTPSVVPSPNDGDKINVTNKVFTEGPISISFSKLTVATTIGSQIATYLNPYTGSMSYYLRLTVGTRLIVSSSNGATIDAIHISSDSSVGNMNLDLLQPGSQSNMNREWVKGEENVTSVAFLVTGNPSEIYEFTVDYTEPSAVLEPVWSNIHTGDTVPSFKSLVLKFGAPMSIQNSKGITFTSSTGNRQTLTPTVNNDTIFLSLADPITKDGKFNIFVPARSFRSNAGYENLDILRSFTVREPRNILVYDSISVKPSKVLQLPNPLVMYFPRPVKVDTVTHSAILFIDDDYELTANVSPVDDDSRAVAVSFTGSYNTNAVYRLNIPEGVVHLTAYGDPKSEATYDRWNPELNLIYTIDGTLPDPEPIPDSEVMMQAKALLDIQGLGYPTMSSDSRKLLDSLTTSKDVPNDSVLIAAMERYYSETDVVMPATSHWYTITGINSDRDKLFLTFNADTTSVGVSKDSVNVAVFEAVEDENGIAFKTRDGKFLHVLTTLPNYDLTTVTNLSDTLSAASILQLRKYPASAVDGLSPKDVFGLFTIRGSLGKKNDKSYDAYALLDYTEGGKIVTDPDMPLAFDAVHSSAFVIEETDRPSDEKRIEPSVYLKPGLLTSDTLTATLVFGNVKKVQLADVSKAYFRVEGTDSIVKSTARQILTPVEGSDSLFTVHVNGLEDNIYELVMPVGTFSFKSNPAPVLSKQLTVVLQINSEAKPEQPKEDDDTTGVAFNRNFYDYIVMQKQTRFASIADKDLEDLVIFAYIRDGGTGGIATDTTKQVKIVNSYFHNVIATGHFVPYPQFAADYGEDSRFVQAIKLVMDTPITEGMLNNSPGVYGYDIPAATFGDINFGKYLDDNTSIDPSECLVNAHTTSITFYVDNDEAKPSKIAELKEKAVNLLKLSGIGMPAENSIARTALASLLDSGSATADDYSEAIKNFYLESDVNMPLSDDSTYYKVCAVGSDGRLAYLCYDGIVIGVTMESAKATGFKMVLDDDGTYTFVTGNGKVLSHWGADDNVSDASALGLTVARLMLTNNTAEKTLGMFSIQAGEVFALVDLRSGVLMEGSAELDNFSTTVSNAFKFEAVNNDAIPVPGMSHAISPTSESFVTQLNKIVVTFSDACKVSLADRTLITLSDVTGHARTPANVEQPSANRFEMTFTDLAVPGATGNVYYQLTAREGAFIYEFADLTHKYGEFGAVYVMSAEAGVDGIVYDVDSDAPVFDLQGRKTENRNLRKGLYIQNGKKKVVK